MAGEEVSGAGLGSGGQEEDLEVLVGDLEGLEEGLGVVLVEGLEDLEEDLGDLVEGLEVEEGLEEDLVVDLEEEVEGLEEEGEEEEAVDFFFAKSELQQIVITLIHSRTETYDIGSERQRISQKPLFHNVFAHLANKQLQHVPDLFLFAVFDNVRMRAFQPALLI